MGLVGRLELFLEYLRIESCQSIEMFPCLQSMEYWNRFLGLIKSLETIHSLQLLSISRSKLKSQSSIDKFVLWHLAKVNRELQFLEQSFMFYSSQRSLKLTKFSTTEILTLIKRRKPPDFRWKGWINPRQSRWFWFLDAIK
jgi:hypothetical protein